MLTLTAVGLSKFGQARVIQTRTLAPEDTYEEVYIEVRDEMIENAYALGYSQVSVVEFNE